MRKWIVVLGALVAASCAEPPDPQQAAAALRQKTYEMIDVAATTQLEWRPSPASLSEVRGAFARNEKGVFCSGASYVMLHTFKEAGYKAWSYHYGFYDGPGMVNHVTTLVEIDGEIYIQDAYLNFDYPVPFFELLDRLKRGDPPEARIGGGLRDVIVPADTARSSWAVTPDAECAPLPDQSGIALCRSEANLVAFKDRYMRYAQQTYDRLEADGRPRDLSYLLLYPRALSDGERYADKPGASELLDHIFAATESARRRDQK